MKKMILVSIMMFMFMGVSQAKEVNNVLYDGVVTNKPSVKIATFNIRASRMGSTDNLVDAVKKINADIIALQEVDNKTERSKKNFSKKGRTTPVNQAKYIAEKTGMNYLFFKTIDFDGGEYGIALLSKYPMEYYKEISLPNIKDINNSPNAKNMEARKAGSAFITIPGMPAPILAVVTHITNGAEDILKIAQTTQISRSFTPDNVPNAMPIIMGDFNAVPSMSSNLIMERYFKNIDKNMNYTAPAWNPDRKIDYIWVSNAQKWEVSKFNIPSPTQKVNDKATWGEASDHLPIVTTLTLLEQ